MGVAEILARFDDPASLVTTVSATGRIEDRGDDSLFQWIGIPSLGLIDEPFIPFTRIIPTINIGSALGIDDWASRTLLDVVADPLNFLGLPGLTKAGRVAEAARFVSSDRKLEQLARIDAFAQLMVRDRALGEHIQQLARTGDLQGLSKYRKYIDDGSEASKTLYAGREGEAIKRALDMAEAGEVLPRLKVGAAAQAEAGQFALGRFSVPFTSIEGTFLKGDKLLRFAEDTLGIKWLKNKGAKAVEEMHRTITRTTAAEQGADDVQDAVNLLEEIHAGAERGKPTKALGRSLARLQALLPTVEANRTNYKLASTELRALDSATHAVERTLADGSSVVQRVTALNQDLEKIQAALVKGKDLKRAEAFTDFSTRTGNWVLNVGKLAEITPAGVQNLLIGTSQQVNTLLRALPPEATGLGAVPTLDIEPIRLFFQNFEAQLQLAIKDPSKAGALLKRDVLEDMARVSGADGLFARVPTTIPVGNTELERWAFSGQTLVNSYAALAPALRDAIAAAKKVKKAPRLEPLYKALGDKLATVGVTLQHVNPDAGLAFVSLLDQLAPGASKRVPIGVPIAEDAASVADDVVAALNNTKSTDFGGNGRPLPGSWGRAFNPDSFQDAYHSDLKNSHLRIDRFFSATKSAWQQLMGAPSPTIPRGFTDSPAHLDQRLAGQTEMFHVSTSMGIDMVKGTISPSEIARPQILEGARAREVLAAESPKVARFTLNDARNLDAAFADTLEYGKYVNERTGFDVSARDIGLDVTVETGRIPSVGALEQTAAALAFKTQKPVQSFVVGPGDDTWVKITHGAGDRLPQIRAAYPQAAAVSQEAVHLLNPTAQEVKDFVRTFGGTVEEFHGRRFVTEPGRASQVLGSGLRPVPATEASVRAYYDTLPAPGPTAGAAGRAESRANFGDTVWAQLPAGDRVPVAGQPLAVFADAASAGPGAQRIRLTQNDLLARGQAGDLRLITGRPELHRYLDFTGAEPWLEETGRLSPVDLPDPARVQRSELHWTREAADRRVAQLQLYAGVAQRLVRTKDEVLRAVADVHHLAPNDPDLLAAAQGLFRTSPTPRSLYRDLDALNARLGKAGIGHMTDEVLRAPEFDRMASASLKDIGAVKVAVRGDAPLALNMGQNSMTLPTADVAVVAEPKMAGASRFDLFMRAMGDPSLTNQLTYTEKALYDLTAHMLDETGNAAHGAWFTEFLSNYFPRLTRPALGVSMKEYKAAMGEAARATRSTSNMRQRLVRAYETLLNLEKRGTIRIEKNPMRVLQVYFEGIARMATNQKLLDVMRRSRAIDGAPMLIPRKGAQSILAKAVPALPARGALDKYMAIETERFPVLSKYLLHKDFSFVTKMFGPQSISEAIRESNSAISRGLQYMNLAAKGAVLSLSFFHYVALQQSLIAAVGLPKTWEFFLSQFRNNKLFRAVAGSKPTIPGAVRASTFGSLWGEAGELMEFAVSHGMIMDPVEKIASQEFAGFLDKFYDAVKRAPPGDFLGPGGVGRLLISPVTGLRHVNDFSHKATWEIVHNSGKGLVFQEYLGTLMKQNPGVPIETLARQAAQSTNSAFGGLNWSRIFGDHRIKAILQTVLLAPDWTISNLMNARDLFVGLRGNTLKRNAAGKFILPMRDLVMPTAAATLARRFWFNSFLYIFLTKQAVNYAINGHSTLDNPGGPEEKLEIWTGRRDPTNGQPIMVYTGKQFTEPVQLLLNPTRFLTRKTSVGAQVFSAIVTQRDQFGQQISYPEDSFARLALANTGFVVRETLPIPFQASIDAYRRFAEGRGTELEFVNTISSGFDVSIRRAPLKPKSRDEAEKEELPSTVKYSLLGPDEFGGGNDRHTYRPRIPTFRNPAAIR